MGGMVSIATLIARKLEPLMIQRDTRISHLLIVDLKSIVDLACTVN
jgi:hypothetical protein